MQRSRIIPRQTRMTVVCLSLISLISLISLVAFGTGCAEKESLSGPARSASPRELAKAKNGTEMISPVSGKTIVKANNTPALVWDGKLYMFCCDVDRQTFKDDPNSYSGEVLPPNAMLIEP